MGAKNRYSVSPICFSSWQNLIYFLNADYHRVTILQLYPFIKLALLLPALEKLGRCLPLSMSIQSIHLSMKLGFLIKTA